MKYKNRMKAKKFYEIAKVIIAVLFFIFLATIYTLPHKYRQSYNVTIIDKQVKRSDKDDKYLIYTQLDNGEVKVFEDTDSFIEGKYNSSDIYGELKENKKYMVEVYGWRIPFLSQYENIVDVKEM